MDAAAAPADDGLLAQWASEMQSVMQRNSLRVLDLFRQFDRDDSGKVR